MPRGSYTTGTGTARKRAAPRVTSASNSTSIPVPTSASRSGPSSRLQRMTRTPTLGKGTKKASGKVKKANHGRVVSAAARSTSGPKKGQTIRTIARKRSTSGSRIPRKRGY